MVQNLEINSNQIEKLENKPLYKPLADRHEEMVSEEEFKYSGC